jgi:predicted helicase
VQVQKKPTSTASSPPPGKKPFAHRIIVSTTSHWSEHAEDALTQPADHGVSKIDLAALENSHRLVALQARQAARPQGSEGAAAAPEERARPGEGRPGRE